MLVNCFLPVKIHRIPAVEVDMLPVSKSQHVLAPYESLLVLASYESACACMCINLNEILS